MNNDISVNLIYHKIIMRQCGTKSQYSLIKKLYMTFKLTWYIITLKYRNDITNYV